MSTINAENLEEPPLKQVINADKKGVDDVLEALGDHASILEEPLSAEEDRRILRMVDFRYVVPRPLRKLLPWATLLTSPSNCLLQSPAHPGYFVHAPVPRQVCHGIYCHPRPSNGLELGWTRLFVGQQYLLLWLPPGRNHIRAVDCLPAHRSIYFHDHVCSLIVFVFIVLRDFAYEP